VRPCSFEWRHWRLAKLIPGLVISTAASELTLECPRRSPPPAHKIACVVYHRLKYQEEFLPLEVAVYELEAQERRMRNCENRLKSSAANSEKGSKLRNGYLEEGRQRMEASIGRHTPIELPAEITQQFFKLGIVQLKPPRLNYSQPWDGRSHYRKQHHAFLSLTVYIRAFVRST